MDFNTILNTVKEYVPIPVIVAVVAVIMLVYGSMFIASLIEDKKSLDAGYKHGTPIFMTGKELILYRK